MHVQWSGSGQDTGKDSLINPKPKHHTQPSSQLSIKFQTADHVSKDQRGCLQAVGQSLTQQVRGEPLRDL
jgi:hypothetical protein